MNQMTKCIEKVGSMMTESTKHWRRNCEQKRDEYTTLKKKDLEMIDKQMWTVYIFDFEITLINPQIQNPIVNYWESNFSKLFNFWKYCRALLHSRLKLTVKIIKLNLILFPNYFTCYFTYQALDRMVFNCDFS